MFLLGSTPLIALNRHNDEHALPEVHTGLFVQLALLTLTSVHTLTLKCLQTLPVVSDPVGHKRQ